ncbi:MAG: sensor histidine kinase, partial [Terriglobia bacterium]
GVITLRASRKNHRLTLEVKDNGVGIPPGKRSGNYGSGIGIRNVTERLRVLFGSQFAFKVDSQPGAGTCVSFEIPELVVSETASAETAPVFEETS